MSESKTSNTTPSNNQLGFKPLSEADVANAMKKLASADPKELNDIFNKYAQALNGVLVMAQKQAVDETEIIEVERIKRIVNFVPVEERFIRTKDKIWAVREHIINKNAKYFMEKDYSAAIKKDGNQAMIETLVDLVKEKFATITEQEKDFYWKKGAMMLNCIVRFKKLVGEYDK